MNALDHEAIALRLRVAAGFKPNATPGALKLAHGLRQRVVWRRGLDAAVLLTEERGAPVIAIREGLSPESAAWAIANGIAGFAIGSKPSELDRLLVAAALVMPERVFQQHAGKTDGWLARAFGVPVAAVQLRRESLDRRTVASVSRIVQVQGLDVGGAG